MLSVDDFKTVIESTPLISIDLVIENVDGEILLGKRNNRPAKGYWFVPGGRVLKDEILQNAIERLVNVELNLTFTEINSKFLGVYQHFYDDNFVDETFSTHYVVLAYKLTLNIEVPSLPQEQHSEYKWFSQKDLLAHNGVHIHSKWYFQNEQQADISFK